MKTAQEMWERTQFNLEQKKKQDHNIIWSAVESWELLFERALEEVCREGSIITWVHTESPSVPNDLQEAVASHMIASVTARGFTVKRRDKERVILTVFWGQPK